MELTAIEMFKGLSNMELAKLLGKLEKRWVPTGEVLFEQGDPAEHMYIIGKGRIELFAYSEGKRQSLALLEEGESLGEMALLTGETRSAAAVAAADAMLYVIDRETFDALISEHAILSSYFIRLLSQRLVATNDKLQESQESKSDWLLRELEGLPEPAIRFLCWSAEIPSITTGILTYTYQKSLSEMMEAYPKLSDWLISTSAAKDPGEIRLSASVRPIVSNLGTDRFGYEVKAQWREEALAYYLRAKEWRAALLLRMDAGNWPAALDIAEQAWREGAAEQQDSIYELLVRCPEQLIAERFDVLQGYIPYCKLNAPELGLSVIERALALGTAVFFPGQLVSLYEWGAALCQSLNRKQQALEYLQMAESMTVSMSQGASAGAARRLGPAVQSGKAKASGGQEQALCRTGCTLDRTESTDDPDNRFARRIMPVRLSLHASARRFVPLCYGFYRYRACGRGVLDCGHYPRLYCGAGHGHAVGS
ncbi:Crp/Fnr family transcriptional regulator [Paenibacillus hexagrammi]|uniref:Crp/Fnr family transcriptional regulator n=1 Tax=Paenibacillus hexagrammi TaxID=2908839 RepID=A0ABY3SLF0_9BACL|nr:Crp/Fnr family transcriptional regulator [Paenibacillus sp. YPD9-1]UJF33940.1 Crp/Fnr family transcriptional regulator [Paenibacillus sp. YPD9-1]